MHFEEFKAMPQKWAWALLTALSLSLIGWGLLAWAMIPDRPRQWNYQTLPDAPGQSIYSSVRTPEDRQGQAPAQIAPLPEATPRVIGTAAAPATQRGDRP